MKTNLLLSLMIVMIYSSCTNNRKSDIILPQPDFPIKINLVDAINNPKEIKLSDIADSIAYIPLEYSKDNPVGTILDFKYFPNNIFIHVGGLEGRFLRFDGKGKFINKIGTMGRGPEEYSPGSSFSVIDNPERFYILSRVGPRHLFEFDYSGKYLAKVLTAKPSVGKLEAISSDRFLFLSSSDTSFHYIASLNDRSDKSLMAVDYPFFSNPGFKKLQKFRYRETRSGEYFNRMPLFYDECSMDIIYSIKNDTIYPKYILDKGTEGAPFEKTYTVSNPPESYKFLCPVSSSFKETPNDVFLMAIFKETYLYLINYNKASQSVSSMKTPYVVPDIEHIKQPATIYPKFENDIDGGISVAPGKSNREGDIWTYKFEAIDFKKRLNKEYLQNSKALNPEKKKAMMQLVDSIKEDDNPIIMVVYLKKSIK